MDFDTAYQFLLHQTVAPKEEMMDTFLMCLRQGKPPVPGQATSLLLALKVIYEGLHQEPTLKRNLVDALFTLAYESRQLYDAGVLQGTDWPPLLDDDLKRIAAAVQSIIKDEWQPLA